jgi:hypothetical protein
MPVIFLVNWGISLVTNAEPKIPTNIAIIIESIRAIATRPKT